MDDPRVEPETVTAAQWLRRWLLRGLLLAAMAFVAFGLFDGFDKHLLWARALAFGAFVSTVGVLPEIRKARRARGSSPA